MSARHALYSTPDTRREGQEAMGVGRELSTRVATEVGAVVDRARGVAIAVAAALADLCTEDRKSDT